MDELQKIAKELEEHPLQHRLVSEQTMFGKKQKEPDIIGEIKDKIIACDKAIIEHKRKIKNTELIGRERAKHITMQRARIKALIKLITIEIDNLCDI